MANKKLCFKLVICGIMIAFIFQDIRAQSSIDCNFNNGFCGWEQDESDDIDWIRRNITSEDYSIYVYDGWDGTGRKARLISSRNRPGQNCLTFLYVMREVYQGALKVFLSEIGGSEQRVFTSAVTVSNRWTPAIISLNTSSEYTVVIEGKRVDRYLYYDTVWLDDIFMARGFCTDCDFDSDFCNWTNDVTNNVNWTLQNSQEDLTGHQSTGSGKYARIGTGEIRNGGTAKLIGPKQSAGKYCISFLYYILGEQVGGLRVLAEDEQHNSQEIKNITGSYSRRWIHNINEFHSAESFMIAFEGRLSDGNGEIAIDDVTLLSCQDCVDPSPKHGHANASTFQYGSNVEITCDTGYNLTGSPFTECQANGVWSNILICDLIDCGNRTIINGVFSADDGTTFGSTAQLICDTGYTLVGNANVSCTAFGWSSPETACIIVEEGKSALIAIYVLASVIFVASAIVITIVFLRKRPKCMNVMSSTNESKTTHNRPYFNETYNGETPQGQIYANMSNANEPIQSTEEYAIVTDCSHNSVKDSKKDAFKYDDKDTYDHTNNASQSFEDTTYSHISGKRSNQTDESSYDTTFNLMSECLTRFADSTNKENCYKDFNNTENIKAGISQANTLIEEPDYDHANAGGPDPTSGDFDDYSHMNRREGNDGNTAGMKSTAPYKQQERHSPKYTVEKEEENDENRPSFVLEAEKMSGINCAEENHT